MNGIPRFCVFELFSFDTLLIITGIRSYDNMPGDLRGGTEIVQEGIGSRSVRFNLTCSGIGQGFNFDLEFFGNRVTNAEIGN